MTLEGRLAAVITEIGVRIKALINRALPSGGTAGQVLAKTSTTDFAVAWTTLAGSAAPLSGVATITVPANCLEDDEVIAVTGVAASNRCFLNLAPHDEGDENHETWTLLDGLTGVCGAGSISVNIRFREPSSGPFKIQYMVM